jgi:Holliday junction resolvase RusA-like endonuclease
MSGSSDKKRGFIDLSGDSDEKLIDLTGGDLEAPPKILSWSVAGEPRTLKQRRIGRNGRYFTASRRDQKDFLAASLNAAKAPLVPWQQPLAAELEFKFRIPRSKQMEVSPGEVCVNTSDVDNLTKFVFDSLQKKYFENDRQFVKLAVSKLWAAEASTAITISKVSDAIAPCFVKKAKKHAKAKMVGKL